MTTLQNQIYLALVLRVKNANPNGDPLNGNRPRTDYGGLGEITDVTEAQAARPVARAWRVDLRSI